jgi:glycine betaine/proline transport system permease protein
MVTAAIPRPLAARLNRPTMVGVVIVCWLILFALLKGRDTLALAPSDVTSLHIRLNDLNTSIGADRNSNPFFVYFINEIQIGTTHLVTFFQSLISQPAAGRPVPMVGWLGVIAVITFVSWVFGNGRVALLAGAGLLFIGLQGLWQEAMDTLALTMAAVLLCLLIGIPLGIWAGLSDRVNRILTPVLDFMQVMPSFVYLAPLALLFLIGPASAVIATLIFAMPPVIRITAHGVRSVSTSALEAAESLGSTPSQVLRKVTLPMAKRTIVLGINQTTMAALAMVTIAALVAAPGLGQSVIQALDAQDVGGEFNAGLAIVILAIVLDRITTAASVRAERSRRRGVTKWQAIRRPAIAVGVVLVGIAIYLSRTYQQAAVFPTQLTINGQAHGIDVGSHIANATSSATDWAQRHFHTATNAIQNAVTYHGINPLQSFLENSPWWLTAAAIVAIAAIVGNWRAAITAAICLAVIVGTGLWQDSMETLAATLIAAVMVMILGVAVGVWMGRSARVDGVIRPVLDAAQTMPVFVYLVPFVALFHSSRFTGVVAAVVYAAAVSIKIVADGIGSVSPTTVEAATASGSSTWQIISRVQIPMSVRSLALATNQGLIYVLSMVVVAGLIGGGALGFDVVAGFSQISLWGKGLAAGVAIVMLGIMLDRVTQAAARRADMSPHTG